jgi:hypothetical protein
METKIKIEIIRYKIGIKKICLIFLFKKAVKAKTDALSIRIVTKVI